MQQKAKYLKYPYIFYLRQRAVKLVNGVHHIQEHVVANYKFTLFVG